MNIKDIDKGLVVYNDRIGFVVVDEILPDGRVSCNDGHIITYPHLLEKVNQEILDDRGITQKDLNARNAHI